MQGRIRLGISGVEHADQCTGDVLQYHYVLAFAATRHWRACIEYLEEPPLSSVSGLNEIVDLYEGLFVDI